mmetsp:Transcript_24980/g.58959  ORF Transcript_24980/g.58959 Transcript_24980/m.58959 type:complete len:555 (-) Transcript_24980:108-1772(-)
MSNPLFSFVIILMVAMVSRFPLASAFVSRISKSSTTQRSQRSIRNFLLTGAPTSSYLERTSRLNNNYNIDDDIAEFSSSANGGYNRPIVQWYPGHIAKAERQLSETLKAVDVVVEVRDARACKATAHPRVGEWCAGRPRIVVLTHLDMVPKAASGSWRKAYETLGAERWDEAPINRQVANQAKQARDLRSKFDDSNSKNSKKRKKNAPNGNRNDNDNDNNITPVEQVLFVNAKQGQGIHALHRAIFKAGAHVQERRERRGLNPRALRVGIIGYPNVGKSALINKILGRKRAKTENKPGVTRSLQWIRVRTEDSRKAYASGKTSASPTSSTHSNAMKREFELLDSPGIIPAKMVDQSDALLLAACNCIGEAAYDNQAVAAFLCEWLKAIHIMEKQGLAAPDWQKKCKERYGFDPLKKIKREDYDIVQEEYMTGEDMLFKVADNLCRGDAEDASRKILQDFRSGRMGPISLQLAPESEEDDGQLSVPIGDGTILGKQSDGLDFDEEFERQAQEARARIAVETAKERGLELPPIVDAGSDADDNAAADVGKGMFDGW